MLYVWSRQMLQAVIVSQVQGGVITILLMYQLTY